MDTDPSPVRLWESEGHSEGYRTAYEPPSESEETPAPIACAYGPRARPEARRRGLGWASQGPDGTWASAHGTRDGRHRRYAHGR